MKVNVSDLNRPFNGRAKWSWLKAILAIIIYFVVRTACETGLILMNLADPFKASETEMLKAMTLNQPLFLAKEIFLLVVMLGLVYLFKLDLFNLKQWSWRTAGKSLAFFAGVYLLEILFAGLVTYFAPDYLGPDNQIAIQEMMGNMNYGVFFFMVVIAAPIVEEIICRGLIMKHILGKWPWLGALVASVFFVILHGPDNWIDFMTYFILSAGITLIYLKTRRLEYAIMAHMCQNLIAALLM